MFDTFPGANRMIRAKWKPVRRFDHAPTIGERAFRRRLRKLGCIHRTGVHFCRMRLMPRV